MNTAAPLQNLAAKPQPLNSSTHAGLLLQRKCACGSPTSSLTGECAECKSKKRLQTKLAIGASNDPLEQEADRVADQVLAAPANAAVRGASPRIQRFTGQATGQADTAPASVDRVLAGSGRPLEPTLRQDMEQRFDYDFSQVRVHSGAAAEQSARDVNAHAYTVGHNIVFGAGQFAPGTHGGRRLLAHELTHVMQQDGNARDLQQDSKLDEENDRYKQDAERSAAQFMSGAQVQIPSRISYSLIQRTKVCSKRLDNPLGRWFNHSYIDDTGSDNCLGKSMAGNYAIQTLISGNFLKGCAIKTATSTDPQEYSPNVKQCDPKPGVKDLSKCLRDTYNSYADPSLYKNPSGPNSNTFAATLAKTCCADGSSKGLGRVPGWDENPAPPCPEKQKVYVAGGEESPKEEAAT